MSSLNAIAVLAQNDKDNEDIDNDNDDDADDADDDDDYDDDANDDDDVGNSASKAVIIGRRIRPDGVAAHCHRSI